MVKSETGLIILILAIFVGIFGTFIALSYPYPSFGLFELVINITSILFLMGLIIYFVGDKPSTCYTCGNKIDSKLYICPICHTRTRKYFHQKVVCTRCFRRSRYDKYGGLCKYCGTPLHLA